MAEFLAMGGYAAYVWPAYAASFIVLGAAAMWTAIGARNVRRRLAQLEGPAA
jgi:heme exporter protein D